MMQYFSKILLINLPHPGCSFNLNRPYVFPLGIYYLKAMAYRENLLKDIDVVILDTPFVTVAGDALLIDTIIKEKPDVIGFSCFCWNLMRTLYIAEKIKDILKKVKIIAGGPEITRDNLTILAHKYIDIAVLGEGEETFVELINYFLGKISGLSRINGIAYKENNNIVVTKERFPVNNLDDIPSPFLLEYINPVDYPIFFGIEITRGCPFKCKYCYYPKGLKQVRSFSLKRIKEELVFIKKNKIYPPLIKLYGSTFNIFPKREFKKICYTLGDINNDRALRLYTSIRADILDKEQAEYLSKSTIADITVGLQSVEEGALVNIGRKPDLKKFIRGLDLLRDKGITVKARGGIIGLPGDTLVSIEKMYAFLIKNNLAETTEMYPLYLLPGTPLREEAKKFEIEYSDSPPYYVISTPTLSYQNIRQSLMKYEEISTGSHYRYIRMPLYYFSEYSQGSYSKARLSKYTEEDLVNLKSPVMMLILELKNDNELNRIDLISKLISRKTANNIMFWFKFKGKHIDTREAIKKTAENVLKINPHIDYHIAIDMDYAYPIDTLLEIDREVIEKYHNYSDGYWHYRCSESHDKHSVTRYSIIFPFTANIEEKYLKELRKKTFIIWRINLLMENVKLIENKIKDVFRKTGDGVLLNFADIKESDIILESLRMIKKYNKDKQVRFNNWTIEQIWNNRIKNDSYSYRFIQGASIKYCNDEIEVFSFSKEELLADLAEWQVSFAKMPDG